MGQLIFIGSRGASQKSKLSKSQERAIDMEDLEVINKNLYVIESSKSIFDSRVKEIQECNEKIGELPNLLKEYDYTASDIETITDLISVYITYKESNSIDDIITALTELVNTKDLQFSHLSKELKIVQERLSKMNQPNASVNNKAIDRLKRALHDSIFKRSSDIYQNEFRKHIASNNHRIQTIFKKLSGNEKKELRAALEDKEKAFVEELDTRENGPYQQTKKDKGSPRSIEIQREQGQYCHVISSIGSVVRHLQTIKWAYEKEGLNKFRLPTTADEALDKSSDARQLIKTLLAYLELSEDDDKTIDEDKTELNDILKLLENIYQLRELLNDFENTNTESPSTDIIDRFKQFVNQLGSDQREGLDFYSKDNPRLLTLLNASKKNL